MWEALTFVLNGLVFVLIGLHLPTIRAAIRAYSLGTLLLDGAIFSGMLILMRLVWTFPGAGISYLLRTRIGGRKERFPRVREIFVVGWTGMRGVVSLAAALALLAVLADGTPFPQRDLIVFFTFCVIVVTLVLQGVTLPPLIRALGLGGAGGSNCEELEARRMVLEPPWRIWRKRRTAIARRHASLRPSRGSLPAAVCGPAPGRRGGTDGGNRRYLIFRARPCGSNGRRRAAPQPGRINDEVLRRIERELDLTESRWSLAGREDGDNR